MMVVLLLSVILSIVKVKGKQYQETLQEDKCSAPGNPLPPACSQHHPSHHGGEPLECHYGKTRDTCGNMVCMKGPGEMCGGKYGRSVHHSFIVNIKYPMSIFQIAEDPTNFLSCSLTLKQHYFAFILFNQQFCSDMELVQMV